MKESSFVRETQAALKLLHVDILTNLHVYDELDSTNRVAKDLAHAGAEEGTVVIAHEQTQGRGRFERRWQSPPGGIYLSMVLRPRVPIEKASLLPLVAALAVAKTINSYGVHATIKWPNDVRVNGKKIAGILLESQGRESQIIYVVVGIGINLNIDNELFSSDIQSRVTSLSSELSHAVDYYEFLKNFILQLQDYYTVYQEQQYDKVINEWKIHTDTLGKTIQVKTTTELLQGVAFDVDMSGFLLLRKENGEIRKILSGDCLYLDEL